MSRIAELVGIKRRNYKLDDNSLLEILGGYQTAAGVRVNETTALQASAVYACVRAISEDVAKLPLIVYRRLENGGKERAQDHPLYTLLHDQPNEIQTAFSFRETMQAALLLYGNAYAYIDRDRAGRPIGLWYLHPSAVTPEKRRTVNGRYAVVYHVRVEGAGEEVLSSDYILHIPGLGFDGVAGVSVLRYARESLGTFLAAQEYGARFFGNDTTPGMVLVAPRHLSETERQALHQQFKVRYEGASKKFRMAIIDQGWEIRQLGINLEDAQFVQLMQFGVEEIARLFRVPPHKIGHLLRATFSNIEQQNIEYYTDTLESWLVRWEQVLNTRLLLPSERREYVIEHLMDSILRADTESRYRAYATGIQWGILTPAEARSRENLNPLPGTEMTWMPLNMVPVPNNNNNNEAEESRSKMLETRARSVNGPILRHRLALSHRPIFHDAMGRVIRREVNDIRQVLKRYLGARSEAEMAAWINQYYQEMPVWMERYMMPAYHGYAEAVAAAISEELNAEIDNNEAKKMAGDMASSYVAHHTSLHRNRLKKRLRETHLEGGDVGEELEKILSEWEETLPDRFAAKETILVGGALARRLFSAAGVAALVWVTTSSNPCPLCASLAGMKVGQDASFVPRGGTVEAEGVSPLQVENEIAHPPLHEGCECIIAAG